MINKDFFNRNAEIVARELLGKIIVRKTNEKELKAKIVETEAYFDENDPASRATKGGDLRETMKMEAGTILVYGVHNSWLMNFVTDRKDKASAVLIRAIEPLNFNSKCSGPGLLTKNLEIDKSFHKRNILNDKEIWIEDFFENFNRENIDNKKFGLDDGNSQTSRKSIFGFNNKNDNFEIVEGFRVGVKKDLPRKLRFYINDNKFVSKK